MIFTQDQIQEILDILEYHSIFIISSNLGTDILNKNDIEILHNFDISVQRLYEEFPPAIKNFFFGRLTAQLSDYQAGRITYNDFLEYINRGQYIPLSRREKNELDVARNTTYNHIKTFSNRMKDQVKGIISEEDSKRLTDYEKVFRKEIEEAIVNRKSIGNIISNIGHITGDWNRDWGRLVDTEMNNIFQRGRAQTFMNQYGENAKVYKDVYPGACRHCIRLYLTNGIGSQPRIFTLQQLIDNGTNIGRKVVDWKATLDGIHPFCRCNLHYLIPGKTKWDEENQKFIYPEKFERKVERKSKIKIKVGAKTFEV